MKHAIISLVISILIGTGCHAQNNTDEQVNSSFTDPGEYACL